MAEGESQKKKIKIDLPLIFTDFRGKKSCIEELRWAVDALTRGYNRMNFILIQIIEANARSQVPFTKASCDTVIYSNNATYAAGTVFQTGIDVLEHYTVEREDLRRVPVDDSQRKALEKLLLFLTEDHDGLFPKKDGKEKLLNEGEWAVKVAEHLLTKLAVDNNYVLTRYPKLPPDTLEECTGRVGDTSFGCEQGWHGYADILMEYVPVQLIKEPEDPQPEDPQDSEASHSSIEIKSDDNFIDADQKQLLLAQTIVFSFLQMKYNKIKLTHSLIPAIGISSKHLYINLYDCINDVFLQSDTGLEMFGVKDGDKRMIVEIVVLLWLTLNYRYFCTGINEEMKNCKADFHKRLDDMITVYSDQVKRPVHVSIKQREAENWAAFQGRFIKKELKNEYSNF